MRPPAVVHTEVGDNSQSRGYGLHQCVHGLDPPDRGFFESGHAGWGCFVRWATDRVRVRIMVMVRVRG